jgi:TfoX/Sxy family transcriptional regulator of competence genes
MAYDELLAARIRDLLAGEPGVTERKMFGGLAFLVRGNMAVAASHEGGILLHVDPDRTEALLAEPHTDPFVMRGRRMAGWMRVLADGLESDQELERWAGLGVTYARSLPPK